MAQVSECVCVDTCGLKYVPVRGEQRINVGGDIVYGCTPTHDCDKLCYRRRLACLWERRVNEHTARVRSK